MIILLGVNRITIIILFCGFSLGWELGGGSYTRCCSRLNPASMLKEHSWQDQEPDGVAGSEKKGGHMQGKQASYLLYYSLAPTMTIIIIIFKPRLLTYKIQKKKKKSWLLELEWVGYLPSMWPYGFAPWPLLWSPDHQLYIECRAISNPWTSSGWPPNQKQ